MRKVAVLMLGLAVSGCADFTHYLSQTTNPWSAANAPIGDSETFQRIRGKPVQVTPLVEASENIWPTRIGEVPSLQDISNPDSTFNQDYAHTIGQLNVDLQDQLDDGAGVSIGEMAEREHGLRRQSEAYRGSGQLPSQVPDRALNYLEKKSDATIAIPNGDGTTTLIAPDGSIKVVRGMPENGAAPRRTHRALQMPPLGQKKSSDTTAQP